jgi:hypothetical protein
MPLLQLVWLVYRGWVTDIDVQLRKQRLGPMLFTLICTGIAWLVMGLGMAPFPLVSLAGAVWLQLLIIFFITLRPNLIPISGRSWWIVV